MVPSGSSSAVASELFSTSTRKRSSARRQILCRRYSRSRNTAPSSARRAPTTPGILLSAASIIVPSGRTRCLALLYVVAPQRVLILDVEPSVGDDGMGPRRRPTARRREPAALDVFLRIGLDQVDRPALIAIVKMTVGKRDRTLAGDPLRPLHLACLEVEAGQQSLVRAVEI